MKKRLFIVFFLATTVFLTACNNGENREQTQAEAAALAYAEAVLENDNEYLNENTCGNVPSGSTSLDTYALFTIGMAVRESLNLTLDDLDINLEASTESESADEARIRIQGSVTIPETLQASEMAPLPVDKTTNLDEVWRMQRNGEEWIWCGGTENEN